MSHREASVQVVTCQDAVENIRQKVLDFHLVVEHQFMILHQHGLFARYRCSIAAQSPGVVLEPCDQSNHGSQKHLAKPASDQEEPAREERVGSTMVRSRSKGGLKQVADQR